MRDPVWRAAGRRAAAGLLVATLLGACGARTGTVELRFVLPPGSTAGLAGVELSPAWGGANDGPQRDKGWRHLPLAVASVHLPAGGRPLTVAAGPLPAGRYRRVLVAAPTVTGILADGSRAPLVSHIEPIARGFDLAAGEHIIVDIELLVLPAVGPPAGGREIFVRDARLVEPTPTARHRRSRGCLRPAGRPIYTAGVSMIQAASRPQGARWGARPNGPDRLSGTGLLLRHAWEVEGGDAAALARGARRLGARFVILKGVHGGEPYGPNGGGDLLSAQAGSLRRRGILVWGWAGLVGESPEAEAAAILERAAALGAAGWALEPHGRYPVAAFQALTDHLRRGRPELTLGLLAGRGLGRDRFAQLAPRMDVLLPRLAELAEIDAIRALAPAASGPLVPVLDAEAALSGSQADSAGLAATLRQLWAAARQAGYPAVAVMTWEACLHRRAGWDTLSALSAPDRLKEEQQTDEHRTT